MNGDKPTYDEQVNSLGPVCQEWGELISFMHSTDKPYNRTLWNTPCLQHAFLARDGEGLAEYGKIEGTTFKNIADTSSIELAHHAVNQFKQRAGGGGSSGPQARSLLNCSRVAA